MVGLGTSSRRVWGPPRRSTAMSATLHHLLPRIVAMKNGIGAVRQGALFDQLQRRGDVAHEINLGCLHRHCAGRFKDPPIDSYSWEGKAPFSLFLASAEE